MAFDPLASTADLTARGVDTTNAVKVAAALKAASFAVRDAAGSTISSVTSTVDLVAPDSHYLRLPGGPITSVGVVLVDGELVTDFVRVGDQLWRERGWRHCNRPSTVTVTYTHGFVEVPEDIVDLVCALAAAAINTSGAEIGANGNVVMESIDDHRTQYATGADAQVSVMELPTRTKEMLRSRFGNGVAVTGEAR